MLQAIEIARIALASEDVPVGAIVLNSHGEVVGTGHNRREVDKDPTAHAEIVAIRKAGEASGSWRLDNHTIVVTLEPCAMCAQAIAFARIQSLFFGAYDPKGGAIDHGPRLFTQPTCHHSPDIIGGLRAHECQNLLRDFFKKLR